MTKSRKSNATTATTVVVRTPRASRPKTRRQVKVSANKSRRSSSTKKQSKQLRQHEPASISQAMHKPASALRAAISAKEAHALTMALPGMYPPSRLPNKFSLGGTAVAKLRDVRSIDYSTPNQHDKHPGEFLFAVSRSPFHCFALWHGTGDILNPALYDFKFYVHGMSQHSYDEYIKTAIFDSTSYLCSDDVHPVFAAHDSGPQNYGTTYFPFFQEGRHGFWLNGELNRAASFIFTATFLVTTDVTLRAFQFDGVWKEHTTKYAAMSPGLGTVTLSLNDSGFFAFEYELAASSDDFPATYKASISECAQGWSYYPVPNIDQFVNLMGNSRVNAISLLVSNTAPPLNVSGTITGVQLPAGRMLSSISDATNWANEIALLQNFFSGQFLNGAYAFHKPTTVFDFQLQSRSQSNGLLLRTVTDPIIAPSGWIVMTASTVAANGLYPGSIVRTVVDVHVEYQSNSAWLTTLVPPNNEDVLNHALQILHDVQAFHENPIHISDIWQAIKSKGPALLKQIPSVLSILSSVFPTLRVPSALIGAAEAIASRM